MTLSGLEENLKKISAQLIQAHRRDHAPLIVSYLAQAHLDTPGLSASGMFMKAIQFYHPDRLNQIWEEGQAVRDAQGPESFESWKKIYLPQETDVGGLKSEVQIFTADPGDEGTEDEENFTENWGPEEEDPQEDECLQGRDFLTAVQAKLYEELGIFPSPDDLEDLENELNLEGENIINLEGVEFCGQISSMNLAGNRISDISALGKLTNLVRLDLSDNLIKNADDLQTLTKLRELDLSLNEVGHPAFLLKLPALAYVNLAGNPLASSTILAALRNRSVIVIT